MNPLVELISLCLRLRKLSDSKDIYDHFIHLSNLFLKEEEWVHLRSFLRDNEFVFHSSIKDYLKAGYIALRTIVIQTSDKDELKKLVKAVSNSHSGVVALQRFEKKKVFRGVHRAIITPDGACKDCFIRFTEHRYSTEYPNFKEGCERCHLISLGPCPEPLCPCKGEGIIYDASVTAGRGYYGVHFHKVGEGKPVFTPVQRRSVICQRVNQKVKNIRIKD